MSQYNIDNAYQEPEFVQYINEYLCEENEENEKRLNENDTLLPYTKKTDVIENL